MRKQYHVHVTTKFLIHLISDMYCVTAFYPVFLATHYGPGKLSYSGGIQNHHDALMSPLYFYIVDLVVGSAVFYWMWRISKKIRVSLFDSVRAVIVLSRENWLLLATLNIFTVTQIFLYDTLSL